MSPSLRSNLRLVRQGAVLLFVVCHLTFLFVSNTKLEFKWKEHTFDPYESYLGLDQGWAMFTSPLWRSAPFPAARITFDDDSTVEISSLNEPADMTRFARFTGWRLRKFEHYLTVTNSVIGSYQEPMLRRLMESYVARWRSENPNDPRSPVTVTMLRRNFDMPEPGSAWTPNPAPRAEEKITFHLTGPPKQP